MVKISSKSVKYKQGHSEDKNLVASKANLNKYFGRSEKVGSIM